jgi:hypothetical protein
MVVRASPVESSVSGEVVAGGDGTGHRPLLYHTLTIL